MMGTVGSIEKSLKKTVFIFAWDIPLWWRYTEVSTAAVSQNSPFYVARLYCSMFRLMYKNLHEAARYRRKLQIQITTNKMQRFFKFIYFYRSSTCFRQFLRPSSGAHNCTYIFFMSQDFTAACFGSCIRAFIRLQYTTKITNYSQQDATFLEFIFYRHYICFRRFLRPSSGAHNCTYSFRCCQPTLLLAATVDEMEQSSISSTVAASSSIGWQYLQLYVQLCAPDDGWRNRLKHI
jgi:hypothetical protein